MNRAPHLIDVHFLWCDDGVVESEGVLAVVASQVGRGSVLAETSSQMVPEKHRTRSEENVPSRGEAEPPESPSSFSQELGWAGFTPLFLAVQIKECLMLGLIPGNEVHAVTLTNQLSKFRCQK